MSRWRAVALMTMALALVGRPALAQTPTDAGSGLLIGPLTLRPTLMLREAGWDSNIFNDPGLEVDDRTAVMSARSDAQLRVGVVQIDGAGGADYLYFQRYTGERSLNRFVSARLQPQFFRVRPFVAGGYRRTRDRANSEVDVRAPRTEHDTSVGLEAQFTRRLTLETSVRRTVTRFDESEQFRDVTLATRLNRHGDLLQVSMRYELSPLTTFTIASTLARDAFTESPDRNTDTVQVTAGFGFAPDAIIRGRAIAGFRDVRPRGSIGVPSRGPTAGIELSYTLLDRTVFTGRMLRETTVSVEDNPYYLSTLGALEISHNLVGPLDLVGRISRERLDYEALPALDLRSHRDRVGLVGGGFAVRLGVRAKVTTTFEEIRRRSDLADVRDYDRRRLYTTITYGF